MRHGWYARLLHTSPPGPNMLRRTETILEIIARQGAIAVEASRMPRSWTATSSAASSKRPPSAT